MAIIRATKEQVEEYYESDRLSQSQLKLLLKGVSNFLNNHKDEKGLLYYEEKGHFIIGSAVDCILTSGIDQFNREYHISEVAKPGDTIKSVVMNAFNLVIDFFNHTLQDIRTPSNYTLESFIADHGDKLTDYQEYLFTAMNSQEYCMKMKDETRVDRILKDNGDEYFKDLCQSYGKQVLSVEENTLVQEIVESLITNSRTCRYFIDDKDCPPNVDIYLQLPIYFEYRGINCKALLDMLFVVRDEAGSIIEVYPIDLKTSYGETLHFLSKLKSFRYDIQGAWYTIAVDSWLIGNQQESVSIAPFKFIVESTSNVGTPLIYKLDNSLMEIGLNGRPRFNSICVDENKNPYEIVLSKEIKGVNQLVDEYLWYEENGWEEEKVIAENDGVLTIDWNDIV